VRREELEAQIDRARARRARGGRGERVDHAGIAEIERHATRHVEPSRGREEEVGPDLLIADGAVLPLQPVGGADREDLAESLRHACSVR
jgi:hypothetical protein